MNVDNHQNSSRPRPQAAPEVVSLSTRQNARLTSDSDFRRPIAAKEGVSASADAVHPVRKSAANNPQVIVEVASRKPSVTASANRGQQIIVEMSPDVTPIHPERSTRNRVTPTLSAGRRAVSGQIVVEVSPDIPSTSVRNITEPGIASDARPNFASAARKERSFTKNVIRPEVAPDLKPLISKAN